MNNKEIAQFVAQFVMKPKDEKSVELAVGLFLEDVLLPKEVDNYSREDIFNNVLNYYNTKER